MRKPKLTVTILFILNIAIPIAALAEKDALNASIASRADEGWDAAQKIYIWAESGYQETKSSALLASMLEKAGFKVERGVAGIPTAFTATFGSGKPVIGILGEYDALPGLSQQAVPERMPREGDSNSNGHACGHHLFGVASALAAMSIADQIRNGKITGTVRFYGTPAEEGGSGKTFMAREGLFNDCDAVLHWHPGDKNAAGDPTNLARIAVKFRFRGKSAHAASAPEQARSSLDAVQLTCHASELLREHTPDFTRIHHVITSGGGAPNVTPDFAEVMFYVRHPNADTVRSIYDRLVLCARGGALATETELEIDFLGGTYNLLPNDTLTQVTLKNLREQSNRTLTADELAFAKEIQKTLENPGSLKALNEIKNLSGGTSKGSTDVGDVSWVAPTTGFSTMCWVPGTPAHSWQAVAAGGTTIAREGMLLAARVLAATAWDLFTSPETLAEAKREHQKRIADSNYRPLLEQGQKPPLDYRNAGQ